jgi:hypothetical protein
MNNNYPYGNGYSTPNYSYAHPNYSALNTNFSQMPAKTNKIYVTSLEDAMARFADPGSTMLYVLQDETMAFEIVTDVQGRKNYRALRLELAQEAQKGQTDYVTREEFEKLKEQISQLGKEVKTDE